VWLVTFISGKWKVNKWQATGRSIKGDRVKNKILCFEDIIVWQKARELADIVYKEFRSNKDFSFKDQIRRAVVSIGNNIAEGYERKNNNEFRQFLYIAKGSCGEVRSMLYIALDQDHISKTTFGELYEKATIVSKMLSRLILSMRP